MLLGAALEIDRADQQRAVDAGERVGERGRLGEVRVPHDRTTLGERGERFRRPRQQHDVGGVEVLEEQVGHLPAEVAGRSGNRDGHGLSFQESSRMPLPTG